MKKFFSKERRQERVKWYSSRKWKNKRALQLKKEPLCRICFNSTPKRLTPAVVCDHISPFFDDFKGFLEGETQSLCQLCHRDKTSLYDIPALKKREMTAIRVLDI